MKTNTTPIKQLSAAALLLAAVTAPPATARASEPTARSSTTAAAGQADSQQSVPAAALTAPPTKTATVSKETAAPRSKIDQTVLGVPIDLAGYFWVDTGYLNRANAQAGQYDQIANYMQGRFVLSAAFGGHIDEWFAKAQVQLMGLVNEFAKSQYEPHTLDAYLQLGHSRWGDLQVGRFLAWEVYYRGQGIELFTAEEAGALGGPTLYLLDYTRGYKNEAGQVALHAYPFPFLKFELAGVYGQESNQNDVGVRPVVAFEYGDLQIVAGYEWFKQFAQTSADKVDVTSQGFGGRVQYELGPVTFGVDAARANVKYIDIQEQVDTDKSLDKTSVGGFADIDLWRSSIGLGYHRTMQKNEQGEENTHDQAFVSYLYRLPIEGLSVKLVYGFAQAHIEDVDTKSSWENTLHSVRVRLAYVLD